MFTLASYFFYIMIFSFYQEIQFLFFRFTRLDIFMLTHKHIS